MPSRGSAPLTTLPSISTSPALGLRKPVARLSKVDLPQPLGPITATISSSRQVKETFRNTSIVSRRPENEKLMLRNSSTVRLSGAGRSEHRLAETKRLGIDQHERHAGARVAAIGPRMVRASLYHDIAGLHLHAGVVHIHLDLAFEHDHIIDRFSAMHVRLIARREVDYRKTRALRRWRRPQDTRSHVLDIGAGGDLGRRAVGAPDERGDRPGRGMLG